eukprot:TRINITY_DN2831_c0_g6_i1.p1 TRINITY_DN2831_c0_g6~~TRINITY_DN2831_c0_g6_i1.p1  ORF type:complete len:457 (-),score=41.54 TRINITY_DN2831_c0_g6_i1:382-1752(-)
MIQRMDDGTVKVDWSPLVPNVVGQDKIWVIAIQDLPNDTPHKRIYIESARNHGININLVGIGGVERFGEWKFGLKLLWQNRVLSETFTSDNDYIMFVDAWDFFFVNDLSHFMGAYHEYFHGKVVFGADPDCYPDRELKYCFPIKGREYTYINGGFQFGPVSSLRILHKEFRHLWQQGADDQAFWNWVFVNYLMQKGKVTDTCMNAVVNQRLSKVVRTTLPDMEIDSKAVLFQQMCHNSHHISFRGNTTYNTYTNSKPILLHFNGGQDKHMDGSWSLWSRYLKDNSGLDTTSLIDGRSSQYFVIMSVRNQKYIGDSMPFLVYDDIKSMAQKTSNHVLRADSTYDNAAVFQFVRKRYNESYYQIQSIKNTRYIYALEGGSVGCNIRKRLTEWIIEPSSYPQRKEFTIRNHRSYLKTTDAGDLVVEKVENPSGRSDKDKYLFKFVGRESTWVDRLQVYN